MKIIKTEKHFGVLIGIKPKSMNPFLATDGKGAPAVFDRKHRALVFRDELAASPHRVRGKVVAVIISYEVPHNPSDDNSNHP